MWDDQQLSNQNESIFYSTFKYTFICDKCELDVNIPFVVGIAPASGIYIHVRLVDPFI